MSIKNSTNLTELRTFLVLKCCKAILTKYFHTSLCNTQDYTYEPELSGKEVALAVTFICS